MPVERILFVTGRLAEDALRRLLASLAETMGFEHDVAVLGISVAALMSTEFVARKLSPPVVRFDRVILPGWCGGDLEALRDRFGMPFERGPKDLFDLPEFLGGRAKERPDLSRFDVEILAEINHAPRLSVQQLMTEAERLRRSGADVIDLGCIPGEPWSEIGQATRQLKDSGFRVSVDSFDVADVEAAVDAGAELVLSANGSNCERLADSPAELVVIPDAPLDLDSLQRSMTRLEDAERTFDGHGLAARHKARIDPILEPIGFGFAASLARYFESRRRWPDAEMLMGVGNLTELSEVDSAGVNFLLVALCQELRIRSVLTTEVAAWCRSSVRELDLARRLVRHAVENRVLPKHVSSELLLLRDPKVHELGAAGLAHLAQQIRDANFRVFVERGELHLINRDGYWHGTDPFELFDDLSRQAAIDPSHAFYLGYELAKAMTALTLGKQYQQDQPLRWGFLTLAEPSAHERRSQ